MAQPDNGTADITAPISSSLPPKPPVSAHPRSELDDEPASPPRKRPRTHAPSRPAPPPSTMPTTHNSTPHSSQGQINRFPIQPLNRFQGASASIKRPREIAHFSYDDTHTYRDDDSSISYYHPPQLGADLKDGFDTFRHYEDETDPHLDSLLQALVTKERNEGGKKAVADFVTWRGMMTKIMTAPFDMFAEFSMFATRHDGTIYIEEDFPSRHADRAAQASRPPRYQDPNQQSHQMMTYWGYKFEALALLPTPPPDTSQEVIRNRKRAQVSNHAQYCSIISTSFGPHTLLLGGEVDGLSGPKPTTPDAPIPWIELKTAEELPPNPSNRDVLKFERKLLKFWAQSFLLGVPKIIVGWRSKNGTLKTVQEFDTGKIPGMVRRGTACWDGNVCINFAANFLEYLKSTISDDGVYRISLRKKAGVIEVQKVKDGGTGEIVSKEFLEWRKELQQKEVEKKRQGEQNDKSTDEV